MHNRHCNAILALTAAARADTSEEIFRNALKYTVQIKTTVPVPFDGDRKGSGFGAGFLVDAARGWVMTNAHVVSRSPSRVELAFHGQDFSEAAKIYVDPYLDLALIRVNERVEPRGCRRSATRSAHSAIRGGCNSLARAASSPVSPRNTAPSCCRPTRRSTPAIRAAR